MRGSATIKLMLKGNTAARYTVGNRQCAWSFKSFKSTNRTLAEFHVEFGVATYCDGGGRGQHCADLHPSNGTTQTIQGTG